MEVPSADEAIAALYGADLQGDEGTLHVAAVWQAPSGDLFNMHIGPRAPASPTDTFALGLARARADAIVTTGAILRAEPTLDYAGADQPALRDWRAARLGRRAPAAVVVLTARGDLDLDHPAFAGGRAIVMTGDEGAEALAAAAKARGVEVVARRAPGLLDTLACLRDERGLGTVAVEAGPSTSAALYEAPGRLDEVMLSICRAPRLADGVRGAPVPGLERFAAAGLVEVSRAEREEPSGPWSFLRYRRG